MVGGSSFGTVETAPPCAEHAQEQIRHDVLALLALIFGQVEVECVRELSQFKSKGLELLLNGEGLVE